MKIWRKRLFALGFLSIFIGVLFVSYSNERIETRNISHEIVNEVYDKWNVSGYYAKGETLLLELPSPSPGLFGALPLVSFNISIVAPDERRTIFLYEFLDGKVKFRVLENEGALTVNASSTLFYVTGITTVSGNYTAYVDESAKALFGGKPPKYLSFKKIVEEIEVAYPHSNFLPVGIVLIVSGALMFILSLRKPNRTKSFIRKIRGSR